MGIGTAAAVLIPAVAGVGSAVVGASAAKSAAKTQANAEGNAISQQQQEWNKQQENEAPFLQQGQTAVNNLANLVNNPSFSQYPGGAFAAPTLAEAEAMPGYQFQLGQGTQAIAENAAATGNLLSGNTGTALENYGQGLAQTGYNNLYNQALNTYMTNYGVWNTDTSNQVNRLQNLANLGANTAANLGTQGQAEATNVGNELVGQGTALASGTVGAANAINSGLGSISNAASQIPLYAFLAQQTNSSYSPGGGGGAGYQSFAPNQYTD